MAQEIFRRTEKKFLLSEPQYTALIEHFSGRMERDEYGRYEILNLYYDTEDCRMIRNSLGHPKYKEKLRLRSYGVPEKESMVFLEIKKKYGGIVYKRRAELSLAEAENWMDRGIPPKRDAQILREIDYVRRQWDLSAKAEISYEREAWRGIREREFRITFDRRLRARRERLFLEEGPFGEELLPGGDSPHGSEGAECLSALAVRSALGAWDPDDKLLKVRELLQEGALPGAPGKARKRGDWETGAPSFRLIRKEKRRI